VLTEALLSEIVWCPQHGQPVLLYDTVDGDRRYAVTVSAEDARLFAPAGWSLDVAPARQYMLVEAVLAAVGSRLADVTLRPGVDGVFVAELRLIGPAGAVTVPAHGIDGLLLAHRVGLPVRIATTTLTGCQEATGPPATDPLAAYRPTIEALDLDGLGADTAQRGDAG
jgi:bifunctional DNase/RNase